MATQIVGVFNLCRFVRRLLALPSTSAPVTVQLHLSDKFYRLFERVAVALESIDKTLKAPPEDFTAEDQAVLEATRIAREATNAVHDAQERIPHRIETT